MYRKNIPIVLDGDGCTRVCCYYVLHLADKVCTATSRSRIIEALIKQGFQALGSTLLMNLKLINQQLQIA